MSVPFGCGNWSVDEFGVLRGPLRNIRLASSKSALLGMLARNPNAVVPFDVLARVSKNDNALKVVVHRLRTDLAEAGADCTIRTSYAEGYLLRCESTVMVRPSFTERQWEAIRQAVAVAERYVPGIAERAGLPPDRIPAWEPPPGRDRPSTSLLDTALDWGRRNGLAPSGSTAEDLRATNALRASHGLPAFAV